MEVPNGEHLFRQARIAALTERCFAHMEQEQAPLFTYVPLAARCGKPTLLDQPSLSNPLAQKKNPSPAGAGGRANFGIDWL